MSTNSMSHSSLSGSPAGDGETGTPTPADLLELAWGLIANAGGGDWSTQMVEWQEAAARWHNQWLAARSPLPEAGTAEQLAQRFHETYERLAPSFGYETREASAKPWADVPEQNRRLMIAVCAEILRSAPEDSGAPTDTQRINEPEEPGLVPYSSEEVREIQRRRTTGPTYNFFKDDDE